MHDENLLTRDDLFELWVRRAGRYLPPDALDRALAQFRAAGRRGRGDVAPCIELAGRLAGPPRAGREPGGPRPVAVLPADPQLSAAFRDLIAPHVAAFRARVFGSVRPPFRSRAAALRWIAQQGGERVWPPARRPHGLQAGWYPLETGAGVISYRRAGRVHQVVPRPGSPLAALAELLDAVTRLVPLRPDEVVAYALANKPPRLPAATTTVTRHEVWTATGHLVWAEAVIRLVTRHVPYREWRRLYYALRRAWPRDALDRHALTRREQRVVAWVRRRGGVPRRGVVAFWRAGARALGLSTWRAAMMQYRRAASKLKAGERGAPLGWGRRAAEPDTQY